jgi:hypothetical protein
MKSLLSILFVFLIGCGHTPEEIVISVPYYVPVVCEDFGHITGVKPLPVGWVNAIDTEGFQVLGLRGDMYSNLSINSAEALRYIIEQKKAIDYYKKCIWDHNSEPFDINEEGAQ